MENKYQMGETFENDGKTVAFTHEKYVFKCPKRQNLLQNHLHRIKKIVSQTVRKTSGIKADANIEVQRV